MKEQMIDIIGILEPVVEKNTSHYKSDFDTDRLIFWESLESKRREDHCFLWMSRECGTRCIALANAFLEGSIEHQTVSHYAGYESVIAYLVWPMKGENGTILGNVKKVSWSEYAEKILRMALPASKNTLIYEKGEIVQEAGAYMQPEHPKLGQLIRFRLVPDHPEEYESLWRKEAAI